MKNVLKIFEPIALVAVFSFLITCAGNSPKNNTTANPDNNAAPASNNNIAPVNVKPTEISGYKTLDLDHAIKEASERIDRQIAAGTKIAILNFNSTSDQFSVYVIDELTANFVDTKNLIVVDRKEIDLIHVELDFQLSGYVSDESMQELGKILGAQTIVTGSLMEIGDSYRIVIRALSVQTATVEVQYRTDIANDNRVRALLASGKSASTENISAYSKTNTTTANNNSSNAPPKPGTVYNENGHSYEVINQTMTWTDAKRDCEERGGYLATITASGEQAFIEKLLSLSGDRDVYWLGGYCGGDRKFQWVTGESFDYTHWNSTQPDNWGGREDKVEIYRISQYFGYWNDNSNNDKPHFGVIPRFFGTERGLICEWD